MKKASYLKFPIACSNYKAVRWVVAENFQYRDWMLQSRCFETESRSIRVTEVQEHWLQSIAIGRKSQCACMCIALTTALVLLHECSFGAFLFAKEGYRKERLHGLI